MNRKSLVLKPKVNKLVTNVKDKYKNIANSKIQLESQKYKLHGVQNTKEKL